MDIEEKVIATLVGLIVIAAGLFGTYEYGRHVQKVYDDGQAAIAIEKVTIENSALLNNLEVQHEKDSAAIDTLSHQPPIRVRIPTRCSPPPAASGVELPAATSDGSDNGSQLILDDATKRLESKSVEWSNALAACKEVADWAKAQQVK